MRPEDLFELSRTDRFYGRALKVLLGPGWWMATALRIGKLAYWMFVIGALSWLFAQAIDREPPVDLRSVEILTPQVRPGQPLRVSYHVYRHRICRTETSWVFFDGLNELRRFGPTAVEAAGKLGDDAFVRPWTVPPNAEPGAARLRVITSWQCPPNFVHGIYPVTRVSPDLHFEILPREPR